MPADMQVLVRHIRRMAGRSRFSKDSDRLLLESYALDGNQDAFATLVARHATLVAGVCRRVLSNAQDIEDVFQATFLVLSRKAGAVRWHDSIANWLHGVAHRLALRSRADAGRRQALHHLACEQTSVAEPPQQAREIQLILDAELESLPNPQRLPLILCYLEGRTRDEAAKQCGWSLRTLERRLEQGRILLRDRLVRRGLDLSVVLLAASLSEQSGTAQAQLISGTLKFLQAESAAGGLSGSAAVRLAETALPIAGAGYLKLAARLVLALAVTGFGAGAWFYGAEADSSSAGKTDTQQETPTIERKQEQSAVARPLPPGALRLGAEQFRGSSFGQVQYSVDGKRLITAGGDGIQVFDAQKGTKLLQAGADLQFVNTSAAISADGKIVALADSTGAKHGVIFDVTTGQKLCELQPPRNQTTHLAAFSRDGAWLAALASAVQVDLYSTVTGKLVRSIRWEEKFMPPANQTTFWGEVGFLADGKCMAVSIHHTGMIRVFDVASGKEIRQMVVSPNGMAGMTLSPDGLTLVALPCVARATRATGFREKPDESVRVLEAATGKQLGELLVPKINKRWMKIGPDNKTLFANSGKGFGLWNLVTERQTGEVPAPLPPPFILSYSISPDGKTIAYPQQAALHQIEIITGKPAVTIDGHESPITATACSSIDSVIATGDSGGTIILWEGSTGKRLYQFGEPGGAVQQLSFDPRGSLLVALFQKSSYGIGIGRNDESTLRAFNVADGREAWHTSFPIDLKRKPRLGSGGINPESVLAMAIDGDEIALLQTDTIVMLEAKTGRVRLTQSRLEYKPEQSYVFGNATVLSYTKRRNELLVWSLRQLLWHGDWAKGQMAIQPCPDAMRATTPENPLSGISGNGPRAATFSPNGKFLALGGEESYIQLISVETGKEAVRISRGDHNQDSSVDHIVFAPDGRTLFWSEHDDNYVHRAEVSSGKSLRKIPAFGGGATSLAISPDGKSLVVGCADSTAIVWELAKSAGSN